jgi:hypothetical protein
MRIDLTVVHEPKNQEIKIFECEIEVVDIKHLFNNLHDPIIIRKLVRKLFLN